MAVPAGFTTIYTGIITGRSREMLLQISQRSTLLPLPDVSTIRYGRQLTWKYESVTGGSVEKGLMPGHATLQIQDPLKTIFLHLSQARINGATDPDFHVNISGASVDLEALIRLKNVDTAEVHWAQVPVLKLQIYDGVGQADRLHKVVLASRLSQHAEESLFTSLVKVTPVILRYDFTCSNLTGTLVFSDMIIRHMQILLGPYAINRNYEQLVIELYEILNARIWQGLDGAFHVEQAHLMGHAGTSHQMQPPPILQASTEVAVLGTVFQIQQRHFEEGLRRRLEDPIVGIELKRIFKDIQDFPITAQVDPLAVNMLRAGGFDLVWNKPLEHWPSAGAGSGTIDSRGKSEDCLLLEPDEANTQTGHWFSSGENIKMYLHLFFALLKDPQTGTGEAAVELKWEPWNPILDSVYFVNADGTFTTTPTILKTPSVGFDATGAGSLTWNNFFITIIDIAPSTGRLIVKVMGDVEAGGSGTWKTAFDEMLLHFVNPEADDGTGKPARIAEHTVKTKLQAFDAVGSYLTGRIVKLKQEVPHVSYVLESITTGDWQFEFHEFALFDPIESPSTFQVQFFRYDAVDYVDPAEMIYTYLCSLFGVHHWALVGKIDAVLPPEIPIRNIDGQDFFMVDGQVDLILDETMGTWIENRIAPIAFAKVLVAPTQQVQTIILAPVAATFTFTKIANSNVVRDMILAPIAATFTFTKILNVNVVRDITLVTN